MRGKPENLIDFNSEAPELMSASVYLNTSILLSKPKLSRLSVTLQSNLILINTVMKFMS